MFNNQKIRFRILLGYSVPLVLMILVAMAVYSSLKTYEKVHENTERDSKVSLLSNNIALYINKMQRSARGVLLIKGNTESYAHYEEHKKALEKTIQEITPLVKDEKQKVLLGTMLAKLAELAKTTDQELQLAVKGEQAKAVELFARNNTVQLQREVEALSSEFDKGEDALVKVWKNHEDSALGKIGTYLLVGILLAFAISIVVGQLIIKSITGHISSAVNAMASTSTEIAATVNQHERTASQQAAMVNETTTTIQELGASSRQTSEQASSAADVAQSSMTVTAEGAVMVRQAIEGMNSLDEKMSIVAEQILKLGEQTVQIGNLANMVKDLSTEINMLALNAAVEAARAGEHGKGFAVVAGEVRKLANESKKSAEQANVVIADIQKATNATILRTEEGTRVVAEVTGYARNVGELFDSLSAASNNAYENAQQVMLNAKQQATAIGQIVEAMNALNTGARETAAGIVQTKTGIIQLNEAAGNLKQIV